MEKEFDFKNIGKRMPYRTFCRQEQHTANRC